MNICAVRTITSSIGAQGGVSGIWWTSLMPHEAEQAPYCDGVNLCLALCKHCGSIYAVSKPPAASTTGEEQ